MEKKKFNCSGFNSIFIHFITQQSIRKPESNYEVRLPNRSLLKNFKRKTNLFTELTTFQLKTYKDPPNETG